MAFKLKPPYTIDNTPIYRTGTDREINGLKNNNCFYIVKSDVLIKNTSVFNYIQRINKTF